MTTIAAWESLFGHLGAGRSTTGDLVVVGAAGGVGSVLIQLARQRTGLRVIGTVSRPQSPSPPAASTRSSPPIPRGTSAPRRHPDSHDLVAKGQAIGKVVVSSGRA